MAQTHQKWESDFGATTPYILSGLPGLLNDIADGPNSSHAVSVLVGWCKDEAHLRWIEERGLYNVRLGEGVPGAVEILDPRIVGTRVLALRNASGAINGLWRLQSNQGAKAVLKTKMMESGYPSPNHEQYLVFPVERIPGYEMAEWNLEGLKRIRSVSFDQVESGEPILLSLAEFLHACMSGAAAKSELESEFSAETSPAASEFQKTQYETESQMKARLRKEAKK
jgi:hypothetical protein